MKLLEGFKDQLYVVDKIEVDTITKNKLQRMAIQEGCTLKIINKHPHFPFLVEINHNRIAFSRKLANQMEVIPYV